MSDLAKLTKATSSQNILCNLKYSDFGEVKKIIKDTFNQDELNNDYNLPKILVIGGESTGKSSVLENITKCHIFPRGLGMTTKSPIRIILSDSEKSSCTITINKITKTIKENEIHSCIENHFKTLDDIIDEEIIVNICKKGYINMELYDLPGIVAYPPEKATKTLNLAKKYIKENNSIILCTVPATDTRLTNQVSISIIKEFNRCKDTILVLTMIDRVQDDYLNELVYDRLIGMDDEMNNLNIPYCFGVQNRSHKDKVDLDDVSKKEEDCIKYILDIIDTEYENYSDKKDELKNNLGVDNLIKNIHNKYMSYVVEFWIPNIINKLNGRIDELLLEESSIGFILTAETANHLINTQIKNLCMNNIRVLVGNYCKDINYTNDKEFLIQNGKLIESHIDQMDELFINICESTIEQLFNINSIVLGNLENVNLNLYRYENLKNKTNDYLLSSLLQFYKHKNEFTTSAIALYQSVHLSGGSLAAVLPTFLISCIKFILESNLSDVDNKECDIIESDEYLNTRKDLVNKINKVRKNIDKLANIISSK